MSLLQPELLHNKPRIAKWSIVAAVAAILVLTVLEFPPPIGFETRPQANVSIAWLILFLVILIAEVATIPLVFKRPQLGAKFAIVAGSLNLLQIVADQLHLMQPEIAPLAYSLLEYSVGVFSLALIFLAWNLMRSKGDHR